MAPTHWKRRGPLAWALTPLAALFGGLASLRRAAFNAGLARVSIPPRPLIVVGNIAVGGSGKTPVVLWLADRLRRAGHSPGVVSRGYGGDVEGVSAVPADGDPEHFGDEPVLLARRSGCPVFVGRNRPAAAAALVAAHPECSVLISDDGMQHYAMGRTQEIAVVDEQVLGNRLLLPAGPLREPLSRLRKVDLVIFHGEVSARLRRAVGDTPVCAMRLVAGDPTRLDGGEVRPLARWKGTAVHAVAGIGRPERFFETLREHGIEPHCHAFADHHRFSRTDLAFSPAAPILMTSKDAVKCASFALPDCWELPVTADIAEGALQMLLRKLPDGQPSA